MARGLLASYSTHSKTVPPTMIREQRPQTGREQLAYKPILPLDRLQGAVEICLDINRRVLVAGTSGGD